jgi:hypothetical protein
MDTRAELPVVVIEADGAPAARMTLFGEAEA